MSLSAPTVDALRSAVLEGLLDSPKRLPSAYFYDATGSALFESICELPEYYLTRAETEILQHHAAEMARRIGSGALLVEPGCGSGEKACLLLQHLHEPAGFVPIEISSSALEGAERLVRGRFPQLPVHALRADFTAPFALPAAAAAARPVFFFPGSTLGNFDPAHALTLLRRWRALGQAAVVGVDLRKDPATLVAAYDDARGVTAAFNRNLLARINRELGADFDPQSFAHEAIWNESEGRIEMHLRSRHAQTVRVDGRRLEFRAGESIHTENSYKYTVDGFADLAARAGWQLAARWTDSQARFGVQLLA